MTPKQRKNDGYSLVNPYTRTEPYWLPRPELQAVDRLYWGGLPSKIV